MSDKETRILCIHPVVKMPEATIRGLRAKGFIVLRADPAHVHELDMLPRASLDVISRAALESVRADIGWALRDAFAKRILAGVLAAKPESSSDRR